MQGTRLIIPYQISAHHQAKRNLIKSLQGYAILGSEKERFLILLCQTSDLNGLNDLHVSLQLLRLLNIVFAEARTHIIIIADILHTQKEIPYVIRKKIQIVKTLKIKLYLYRVISGSAATVGF